jgi:hypothetical protein
MGRSRRLRTVGEYLRRYYTNEQTRTNVFSALLNFFHFIYNDLTRSQVRQQMDELSLQYLNECVNDPYRLEDDLVDYRESGGLGTGSSTISNMSRIKKYFDRNKIYLDDDIASNLSS